MSRCFNPRTRAALCELCGAPSQESHHLLPYVQGGRHRPENRCDLCSRCHTTAHREWGEGHDYRGPTERIAFLQALAGLVWPPEEPFVRPRGALV